jgi:hypothetical protein
MSNAAGDDLAAATSYPTVGPETRLDPTGVPRTPTGTSVYDTTAVPRLGKLPPPECCLPVPVTGLGRRKPE